MKLTNLKKANNYEVEEWLCDELSLTSDQKRKLNGEELIRWAPFYFYKEIDKVKPNILWRFTLLIIPIYYSVALLACLCKWMATGNAFLGRKFYDNFHSKWMNKLGL